MKQYQNKKKPKKKIQHTQYFVYVFYSAFVAKNDKNRSKITRNKKSQKRFNSREPKENLMRTGKEQKNK